MFDEYLCVSLYGLSNNDQIHRVVHDGFRSGLSAKKQNGVLRYPARIDDRREFDNTLSSIERRDHNLEKEKLNNLTMSRESSRVSTKSKTLRSNTVPFNNENKRPKRGAAVTSVAGKGSRRGENSRTVGVASTVSKRTSSRSEKNGSQQRKGKRGNLNMVHPTTVNNHDRVIDEDEQIEDSEGFGNEEDDNSTQGLNNDDDMQSNDDSSEENSDDDEEEEVQEEEKETEVLPVMGATDGRDANEAFGK